MAFSQTAAAVDDAVFEALGDPADWASEDGATTLLGVMVILDGGDQAVVAGPVRFKAPHRVLEVRRSEVADPGKGSLFTLASGEILKVIAEPQLDAEGSVFSCECAPPR